MKNIIIGLAVGFVVLVSFCVAAKVNEGSATRASYARYLSDGELDIHASGLLNQTLSVQFLSGDPGRDHIRCDLFVGEVISDKHLSQELREKGYLNMECGAIKADLPQ
jgi:hypothetical protein